jgi:hypothetical protein
MAEKRLTKVIAEKLLANTESVSLHGFTELDDIAAGSLSMYEASGLGAFFELDGLTSLSDAAAESHSKQYLGATSNKFFAYADSGHRWRCPQTQLSWFFLRSTGAT